MNSAIEEIGYEKCTGCYGCYNSCKIEGALEFKLTNDGFYKPFITEKCINCGLCRRACPIIEKNNENISENRKVYAGWSKDEEILLNSSSGGIFTEIAKGVLKDNGIIFGVGWLDDGGVGHFSIEKIEDLNLLQKSKYLQSKVNDSYLKVKEALDKEKKVLFVGTPCQIASLNLFIENKEKLLTIDIVCHGIPSYKAYEKYLKEVLEKNIDEIEVDFRNKEKEGWKKYYTHYKNKYSKILVKEKYSKNLFFKGFLKDMYLNDSCYDCSFRKEKSRYGDITLADFWGVPKELENFLGTSAIISNNLKGKSILESIKGNIILKECSYETVLKGNPCLGSYKMDNSKKRGFFEDVDNLSFLELAKKYKFRPKEKNILKKIINYFR